VRVGTRGWGQGARVTTFARAEQALIALQSTKPTVIVSDIGMPQMDGYQFMRAVRAAELGTVASRSTAFVLRTTMHGRSPTRAAGHTIGASGLPAARPGRASLSSDTGPRVPRSAGVGHRR